MNTGKFYEAEAAQYDNLRWCSKTGKWIDAVQKRIIRNMMDNNPYDRILELAVGTGRIGVYLTQYYKSIIGIDLAFNMLSNAQKKIRSLKVSNSMHFVQGDVGRMPFDSKSIDLCLSINALSLIPEYENVVYEVSRVLRPKGIFICNFANLLSYYMPFGLVVNFRNRALARNVWSHWYRIPTLCRLFRNAGFRIVDVQGHIHIPNYLDIDIVLPFVKIFDYVSRNSFLRNFCPSIFFKLVKI